MFYVNKTGCQWRMMPTDFGNGHTPVQHHLHPAQFVPARLPLGPCWSRPSMPRARRALP